MAESSTHRRQARPSGQMRAAKHVHTGGSAMQYLAVAALIFFAALFVLPGWRDHIVSGLARLGVPVETALIAR